MANQEDQELSAGEPAPKKADGFNIMLAGEDAASTQSARALCERLTRRLAGELRVIQRGWRLDATGKSAVREKVPAPAWPDMIILALRHRNRPVPPPFYQFLEECAQGRAGETAVVAIFDEEENAAAAEPAVEDLRFLATGGRLDLFIHTGLGAAARAETTMRKRPPLSFTRWGLNE